MEWVEVTGRTTEEATEAALERLGIVEHDAEIVVVSEAKVGLFGRLREEARVRARVRPVSPRPKRGQRPSRGGGQGGRASSRSGTAGQRRGAAAQSAVPASNGSNGSNGHPPVGDDTPDVEDMESIDRPTPDGQPHAGAGGVGTSRSARRRRNRTRRQVDIGGGAEEAQHRPGASATEKNGRTDRHSEVDRQRSGISENHGEEGHEMPGTISLEEQAAVAKEFLTGLLGSFGYEADVTTRELDEETIEVSASGDDLGLLIGPRGATLTALQDLTRTAVQHRFPARTDRIVVDVAGYRQRRIAALERFTRQVAAQVVSSGEEQALEPMNAADRKVVHDTVNEIDGVTTRSAGEDPGRHVVIAPTS